MMCNQVTYQIMNELWELPRLKVVFQVTNQIGDLIVEGGIKVSFEISDLVQDQLEEENYGE
jgi:hypothetical protein